VRVASERHRVASLLPPPADQLSRGQRALGIDLQRPARRRKRAENLAVLLLEVGLPLGAELRCWPVPARVVAVGQHTENR
jgi:hypothetical protein